MSVKTLAPYDFPSSDALERYKGKQLVFVNWERHRMFSRPFVVALPPDTPFSVLVEQYLAPCFAYHPDFARIDWNTVTWRNGKTAFTPDFARSLKDNGIGHKDLIRMTTPGLEGIAGTGY